MASMLQASFRRLSLYSLSGPSNRAAFSVSTSANHPSTSAPRQSSLSQIPSGSGSGSDSIPASILGAGSGTESPVKYRRQRRQEHKERKRVALKKKRGKTTASALGLDTITVSPYVRKDRQFKTFKPITHSLRWVRKPIRTYLYQGSPIRALTRAKRKTGGRNHHGRVTVRGRGGGHRRRIRLVDFHRKQPGPQEVMRIEYDPNRSAYLALIKHQETGLQSYIIAAEGLTVGDTVESYRSGLGDQQDLSGLDLGIFRTKAIRPGNVLPLKLIPIGTTLHNISLLPWDRAKLVRSAGAYGQLISFVNRSKAKTKPLPALMPGSPDEFSAVSSSQQALQSALPGSEPEEINVDEKVDQPSQMTTHAQVKLQSGEVRLLLVDCHATIGRVSNVEHSLVRLGKAGRTRWLGRKPKVRGVAMNAVDHPHGGGRGKSKSNMHPKDLWGNKTKGPRTRKPGTRNGNQMVVRERPRSVNRMAKAGRS